ncbi:hypothetical protein Tco_1098689, partial [Tanacetum coccineum]
GLRELVLKDDLSLLKLKRVSLVEYDLFEKRWFGIKIIPGSSNSVKLSLKGVTLSYSVSHAVVDVDSFKSLHTLEVVLLSDTTQTRSYQLVLSGSETLEKEVVDNDIESEVVVGLSEEFQEGIMVDVLSRVEQKSSGN